MLMSDDGVMTLSCSTQCNIEFSRLLIWSCTFVPYIANNMDPDQTAPLGEV